jgi:hypothetical protein
MARAQAMALAASAAPIGVPKARSAGERSSVPAWSNTVRARWPLKARRNSNTESIGSRAIIAVEPTMSTNMIAISARAAAERLGGAREILDQFAPRSATGWARAGHLELGDVERQGDDVLDPPVLAAQRSWRRTARPALDVAKSRPSRARGSVSITWSFIALTRRQCRPQTALVLPMALGSTP